MEEKEKEITLEDVLKEEIKKLENQLEQLKASLNFTLGYLQSKKDVLFKIQNNDNK